MSFPKVKFQIDKNFDKQICIEFLKTKKGGVDFGETIIRNHPSLKKTSGREEIYKFISEYYQNRASELTNAQLELHTEWQKTSKVFFERVDNLFEDSSWPFEEFTSYLSVFNCNPRFLHNGTFQIYYLKENRIGAIMHELMHFKFYHHIRLNFPEKYNREKLWEASEIFNTVVLNLPNFQKLSNKEEKGYPDLEEKTVVFKKLYYRSNYFSQFVYKLIA